MSMTATRQALAAELQADLRADTTTGLENTFKIEPGELQAPQKREVGCLWSPGRAELEENKTQELLEFRCRIFLRALAGRRSEASRSEDPARLEAIVEAVYTSLADKAAGNFGVWFVRCVAGEIYASERYCEVTIHAFQANLFPA